jgi:hypothetical protein
MRFADAQLTAIHKANKQQHEAAAKQKTEKLVQHHIHKANTQVF